MIDRSGAPESASRRIARTTSASGAAFPDEAFPCPACGQMLGPLCRVCVACKQPIDPAQIKAASARAPQLQPFEAQPATGNVRFPWLLFSVLLLVRILAAQLAERRWRRKTAGHVWPEVVRHPAGRHLDDRRRRGTPPSVPGAAAA